jgi:hypothetical protein
MRSKSVSGSGIKSEPVYYVETTDNEVLTPVSAFSTYGGPPLSVSWYHLFKMVCNVHNTNNTTRNIIKNVFIVLDKKEYIKSTEKVQNIAIWRIIN